MITRRVLIGAACAILFAPRLAAAARARHELRIYKKRRTMELYVDGRLVRSYRIALGGAPEGDKAQRGDQRTPEGEHYISHKNPRSQFHRFLGLSYPMPAHAERARKSGLIDAQTAARIARAATRRAPTPRDTALGGDVGIHGGGAGADWTLGCIAISNVEIEDLFGRMRVGDRVDIYP